MSTQAAEKTTLVVGANGATGRLLVRQLLDRGQSVRAVVRPGARLPGELGGHERLSIIRASVLELSDGELIELVNGCQSVASCLGHNMSWKGMFGAPRRLVTDALRRLSGAVAAARTEKPLRFVLMSSAGVGNRDIDEPASAGQRLVIGLLRRLLPPHADNEQAAEHLRCEIGRENTAIEWAVVRPDSLTDESEDTAYAVFPSPIRSAIFDAGSTSRINVAHFMAGLITDDEAWRTWKGQMPVIYNSS